LLYGKIEAGTAYALFSGLKEAVPGIEFVSEPGTSLLMQAMATKDEAEVARIRRMGQVTTGVVGQVADFLSSHRAKDGALVKSDGAPLTLGEVKSRINLWLAERGAENPEGSIFAIGRDAGIPHSTGKANDLLRLGQTIVFDIFPKETGGGYVYDFTRTWCLGYAPDEVQALYQDVLGAYHKVMAELKYGALGKPYQEMVCDYFEARGHPTQRSAPQSQDGYVHGLGHGIGLHVHERPMMGLASTEADRLVAGVVITVEPGLYYPERGMGVRLEDSVWVRPDQQFEILAPFPLDLVLPVKS
jgi:Xaa-Pro aminopeptidase